jgi:hypothetical protein
MKTLLKRAIYLFVRNNLLWSVVGTKLVLFADFLKRARSAVVVKRTVVDTEKVLKAICSDMSVKNGVFTGMKYPETKAVGSVLFPKLIGSYEREIQPIIEKVCQSPYTEIVDIGCAEGYYAIGLAMRIPTARIYAYDTNSEAIRLCKQMALANGVSERLFTGSFCDAKTLMSLPLTGKALIISDCEGYEKELFTRESASFLASHDVLIEVHDFMDIEISRHLRNVFESTHDIVVIQSVDDIKKAQEYRFEEIEGYTLAARRVLLAEYRPTVMEWFYLTPRSS